MRTDRRESRQRGRPARIGGYPVDLSDRQARFFQRFANRIQHQQHGMARQLHADLRLPHAADVGLFPGHQAIFSNMGR